ncbi:MAG: hypothetical protein B6226_00640 [Candidatus Cloacimonetes bacterium 4572_65]|nr:MAG: hypothetical protein B6226_00640 [Candidatus Cloacimonetes bacterium 4572_65]
MDQLKDKILETREKRREQASKGWSRLVYMLLLLFFVVLILFKTNNSKFDVFWNVFQPTEENIEQVQEIK